MRREDDKRFLSIRILQLIQEVTTKTNELEAAGIKLGFTDEIIEKLSCTLFELNGADPVEANGLHLSLSDFAHGEIGAYEFLGLLDNHRSIANTGVEGVTA